MCRGVVQAVTFTLVLLTTQAVSATQTVPLDLRASDGSRWFDFFSDAFGQLGLSHLSPTIPGDPNSPLGPTDPVSTESAQDGSPTGGGTNDGFFQISEFFNEFDPDPDTASNNQFGAANIFVNDNDFSDSYSMTLDSPLTGVGVETRQVVGFTGDFNADIADRDAFEATYTTATGAVSGTAQFLNGVPTSLDFTAELTLTYDFTGTALALLGMSIETGSIVFSGSSFDMLVADVGYEPDDPAEQLDAAGNFVGQRNGDANTDPADIDPVIPIPGNFPTPDFAWDIFGTVENVLVVGDYDGNGTVAIADYLLWKSQFGTAGPDADGNGDGLVDAADYTLWRDNLSTAGALVANPIATPEPTAVALFGVAAMCLLVKRRFRA